MKCPHCAKEIAEDSNFCEYCGKKVIILETSVYSHNDIKPQEESSGQINLPSKVWLGVCSLEGVHYANKWGGRSETWAIVMRVSYVILSIVLPPAGLVGYVIGYFIYKSRHQL